MCFGGFNRSRGHLLRRYVTVEEKYMCDNNIIIIINISTNIYA